MASISVDNTYIFFIFFQRNMAYRNANASLTLLYGLCTYILRVFNVFYYELLLETEMLKCILSHSKNSLCISTRIVDTTVTVTVVMY